MKEASLAKTSCGSGIDMRAADQQGRGPAAGLPDSAKHDGTHQQKLSLANSANVQLAMDMAV
eukprot:scaffold314922_cov16-Prasinocladus_malaysianus.AAC.1